MPTQIYDQLLSKYPVGHPLCLNSTYFRNDALRLLSYTNTEDSNPATNPPPQTPQFTLSPGIIYDQQILGDGQGLVLRLLTGNDLHPYGDINVTQLRNTVNFNIDGDDNLYISCISGSSFPQSDISNILLEGSKIVTMIFNIFDASGWLKQGEKVNLNFIREVSGQGFTIDDNTIFDISGTTTIKVAKNIDDLSNDNVELLDESKYNIQISNNYLKLKLTDASYDNYIVKSCSFNIIDNSNVNYLLSTNHLNFYINPATVYELIDNSEYNFIINYSNSNKNSELLNYIEVSYNNFVDIGIFSTYNYILQNNNLGTIGGYFNINQIQYKNFNNLISLTNSNYIIGKIIRL